MKRERNILKHLTNKECKRACEKTIKNANSWFVSAESISNMHQYGKAVSHLILGTEELVKALIFRMQSIGIDIRNIPKSYMFFTDHILRHRCAVLINTMYRIIKPVIGLIEKMRKKIHNPNVVAQYSEIEKALMSKNKQKIIKEFKDLGDIFDWWDEANKNKNKGFYVDYSDRLDSPLDVKKEEYIQAYQITNSFKSQVEEVIRHLDELKEEDIIGLVDITREYNFIKTLENIIMDRINERKGKERKGKERKKLRHEKLQNFRQARALAKL